MTRADFRASGSVIILGIALGTTCHDTPNLSLSQPITSKNIRRESDLMTDDARWYIAIGRQFATHNSVNHSKDEYVREGFIHSNTVENDYSAFKRGMKGIYHSIAQRRICIAI